MSDVEIGAISGGSGSFVTQRFFSGSVVAGATGDVLTITAILGKRVRLNYLTTASGTESDIEIYMDGDLVNQSSTSLTTNASTNINTFKVNQGGGGANVISDLVGREIIVKKTSGSTGGPIDYAYSEGV